MRPIPFALVLAILTPAVALGQRAPGRGPIAPRAAPKSSALEPVAVTGWAAPGVPGGTFEFFGAIPATGMATFGAPGIDADGRLVFAAGVAVPGGSFPSMGLWKRTGRDVELLAFHGEPAPGTSQQFAAFPSIYFGEIPSLADGRLAFRASLQPSATQLGLWSDRSGPLALVRLDGDILPGLPPSGTMRGVQAVLVANGRIVLAASYVDGDDGGYVDDEQEGFWRDDGGTTTLVIRDDAQAPGCPAGVVFGKANTFVQGSFDTWDLSAEGRIAFNGYVKGPGVELLSDEGVWCETVSGLVLLAREGATAPGAGPGAVFGSGGGLHSFGSAYNVAVERNDGGAVIFGAGLRGPNFDYGESLWVRRGGQVELVIKAFGSPYEWNADPAPGFPAGTTFSNVFSGRIGGDDQVAVLAIAGGVLGLWREEAGSLELLARSGGAVPGIPGATFVTGWGLSLGEFTDAGTLYYQGTFAGPGIAYPNDTALFAVDPAGATRIVVRKGDSVRIGPDDERVVSNFGAGTSADDGTKTLKLVFTDGTSGLFTTNR